MSQVVIQNVKFLQRDNIPLEIAPYVTADRWNIIVDTIQVSYQILILAISFKFPRVLLMMVLLGRAAVKFLFAFFVSFLVYSFVILQ